MLCDQSRVCVQLKIGVEIFFLAVTAKELTIRLYNHNGNEKKKWYVSEKRVSYIFLSFILKGGIEARELPFLNASFFCEGLYNPHVSIYQSSKIALVIHQALKIILDEITLFLHIIHLIVD